MRCERSWSGSVGAQKKMSAIARPRTPIVKAASCGRPRYFTTRNRSPGCFPSVRWLRLRDDVLEGGPGEQAEHRVVEEEEEEVAAAGARARADTAHDHGD